MAKKIGNLKQSIQQQSQVSSSNRKKPSDTHFNQVYTMSQLTVESKLDETSLLLQNSFFLTDLQTAMRHTNFNGYETGV